MPAFANPTCCDSRISRLPESFGTPVTWSATDLAELQYPHLEAEVQKQRKEWTGFHSSLRASSPECRVTEEELSWAMGVAYSRAFRRVRGRRGGAIELSISRGFSVERVWAGNAQVGLLPRCHCCS